MLTSSPQRDQSTHYVYDKGGRVTAQISAEGVVQSFKYDNLGQITASTTYATRVHLTPTSSFDTLNLITNAHDRTHYYVYDAAGRERYRISSEGRVMERRYDGVGNVVAELTHTSRLPFPVSGDLTEHSLLELFKAQESKAKQTQYEYDAAGRLITQTTALQAVTRYRYDAQGNVLSKTQANQALWTYKYDEANQLIETQSPVIQVNTVLGRELRSIITRHSYDSFGNLITVVRDAEGLKQTVRYEFDRNNQSIKTIYPDVAINSSNAWASNQRQELIQTLAEEIRYNAFGEMIAKSDKAGHWKYFAYDNSSLLLFSLDAQKGVTYYQYDSFGRLTNKTLYANRLNTSNDFEYTPEAIKKEVQESTYDRHEFYTYNLDNQVIEVSRDAVRMYNPKTGQYDSSSKPTTKTQYNAFGEVIKVSDKINQSEWADTYTYYDNEGNQTALIDAQGYLTTWSYTVFGEMSLMTEHALAASDWDTQYFIANADNIKDRTVEYRYDAMGQLTQKILKRVSFQRLKAGTNAYENLTQDLSTIYSYDALGHLTSTTDAKGNTAYCYYDGLGQLIASVSPHTQGTRGAITYYYDALGQLVETRRWAQGAFEANEAYFLLNGVSAEDVVTQQHYDNQGQLIAQTDGMMHEVFYSYDANGNLARSWQTLKQADGSALIQDKRYTYDNEQHVLQTATYSNTGAVHTQDAQYNIFGELIAKGANGQYSIHVDYDRLGRVWRSNSQGYYQIFVYDLTGQVTQVVTSTNAFGEEYRRLGVDLSEATFETAENYINQQWRYDLQRQDNFYDKCGHLLGQSKEFAVDGLPGAERLRRSIQSQTVDRWGNMLSYTNALGFETHYEYNSLNQVTQQELPMVMVFDAHGVGRMIQPIHYYAYDELGQAIAMIDANGHAVSKEYDALGRVVLERDAKGNTRIKQYNLLEQLTHTTNELGAMTHYTYDKANRLVAVVTPKTQHRYDYDEAGQLIGQTNGVGESGSLWYDALGNQIKARDARGYDTYYEYDASGHKTKEIDTLGHTQSWIYTPDGRLKHHIDLGNQTTSYEYNTNGLLIEEYSTRGKHIKYQYQGDGALVQYSDETLNETVNYSYDAEGQMISKESGRGSTLNDGWVRETDSYQYDALGRLLHVCRHQPDAADDPNDLLSIDYEYDAVGNIRHTLVSARYAGYTPMLHNDYYLYDENNRMTVNKGELVNGAIQSTMSQGSTTWYDACGNIKTALKYEQNVAQQYRYEYTADNQLELVMLNNQALEAKFYDGAGRIVGEHHFDVQGNIAEKTTLSYDKGLLMAQSTRDRNQFEVSQSTYDYDRMGNLTKLTTHLNTQNHRQSTLQTRHYAYELWDDYQQNLEVSIEQSSQGTTSGRSMRIYDANGQLIQSLDDQGINTTNYRNSSIEGIKGRVDKDGQTSYLSVGGKTIGDLRLDKNGHQYLNVYGGFTPSGTMQKAQTVDQLLLRRGLGIHTLSSFLDRKTEVIGDGVLPEAAQDNLGAYTLKAGDTLQSVALRVYGDSSLWYLLADANGISDKNAQAGGSLHVGQRLNIPSVATGQHHTNATHKIINANHMLGTTGATHPLPPTPPPVPKQHNGLFSKIVVGIIAVVATVMTAGVLGALSHIAFEGSGIMGLGASILSGTAATSTWATMGISFTAGFVGNIAQQGVAKGLGIQDSINFKGALITGLATAATAGAMNGIKGNTAYQDLMNKLDAASPVSKTFNIASSAQLMEQNILSQGISLTLQRHQHFDWEQLAAAGITGGLMGSEQGKKIDETLRKIDHNTGILNSEVNALSNAAIESGTGKHFNAKQVTLDTLGSAAGSSIVNVGKKTEQLEILEQEFSNNDSLYLTDKILDIIHPERSEEALYLNYMAKQLHGSVGYGELFYNKEYISIPEHIENNLLELEHTKNLYNSKFLDVIEKNSNKKNCRLNIGHGTLVKSLDFENDVILNKEKIGEFLNNEYETNVNFLAFSDFEGQQEKRGYLPIVKLTGKVAGKSGITIATGFDIGQFNKEDIKKFGFSEDLEKKLLPFVNVKGEKAKLLLPLAKQTLLTTEEANIVDLKLKNKFLKFTIAHWNSNRLGNTPLFENLSSSQQTVLFSRTYHQGQDMPKKNISQKFYIAALNNDWIKAENYLRNYNTTEDWYKRRVNKEANLLRRERYSK